MWKRTTYGISHMLYPKRDGDYSIDNTVLYSLLPSVAQETYNCPNF